MIERQTRLDSHADVSPHPAFSATTPRGGPGSERRSSEHFGFTGHQTFPFRYGWLKKAIDAVHEDQGIFRRAEALVVLGVGKNMVESIRHWGLATQILTESDRGRVLSVSDDWGKPLFLDGYDPYLEDPGSLWLLHWLLATNPQRAGTWYLAFNEFPYPDFQKARLVQFLFSIAEREGLRVNRGTVERDVDCFVRTYTPSRSSSRDLPEDSFNCPLVELGMLQLQPDGTTFQFAIGPKPTLPIEIVGIALTHYFDRTGGNRQSLNLQDCLYGAYSPGQVFKLDEPALIEYLETLEDITGGGVAIDETAGLKQIYRRRSIVPGDLLQRYYQERG